ncbi:hypothetical protein [Burkholderia cenocepacia]|uniref:hypothetical protein n=1 Tax=Burkholderia cenocepacia TaxID=95486 RepID=UPI002AB6CA09|nr:hypothetical protein [Burkholderia cenocepacia]
MIIDIPDVWDDAKQRHEEYVLDRANNAMVREHVRGPTTKALSDFRIFLKLYLNHIVNSNNTNFDAVINGFNRLFKLGSPAAEEAVAIAKRVFDYDSFRDGKHSWNAYELCALARYSVCPYCQLTAIETTTKSPAGKGYRPQLDHYLARSDFPYLALSLGNLVPSCDRCNGPFMKHTKDFFKTPHLNPLKDATAFTFRLRPANGAPWTPTLRAMRESANMYEIEIVATPGSIEATNTLTTFQLKPRYQPHVHDAHRVAKVGRNQGWVRSVLEATNLALTTEDELGFSLAGDGFKKIVAGKMRLDVYNSSKK